MIENEFLKQMENIFSENLKEKEKCSNDVRELLITIITLLKEHSEYMNNINKALGMCDLIGIDEKLYKVIDYLLNYIITSEGNDLISWWLYEDVNHVLYSADTNEIVNDLNDIENLVDYILENYSIK